MRFITQLRKLNKEYNPKNRGFVLKEEQNLITEILHLDELSVDDLRNLRDFVVLALSPRGKELSIEEELTISDKISAITHVIDMKLFAYGEEV